MKIVQDLSREELDELKDTYFYQLWDTDEEVLGEEGDAGRINFPSEIPDEVIFEHYEDVVFSEDDFFCNQA